ncbi:MAG: DUF4831 family protein [Prevotella sp.]|nr:DUF4831 family protein [Prevotella sp.]
MSFSVAQTQISDYQPGVTTDGAIYFLPKTALRINIMVEKTTYTPGDFAPYALRYLRLKDVPLEPSTQYRVISIKQTAIGVADTTKRYAVKFNPKTVAANISLSEDGRLLGINADSKETPQPALFRPAPKAAPVNPRQFMTEEILAAGSTAKMAELTAREIYDLRENRNLLIKGQADFMPKDGEQMKLMLNHIDTQDRVLSSLFSGVTERDTTEHVLIVTPDGPFDRQVLFRLSQQLGLVEADDYSGAPFYLSIENLETVPPVNEEAAAKVKKKQYEAGIYINVPGRLRATIYQGIDVLQTQEHPAAQFGNVELLSGELFNKHYDTHLWLNPVTGSVDRLEAEQPK